MTESLKLMSMEELRKFYIPGKWINSIQNLNKDEVNRLNKGGKTLLMLAVISNYSRITIDALLKAGADYCLKSSSEKNSLEYAIAYNSDKALNTFLKFSSEGKINNSILENTKDLYTWDELEYLMRNPIYNSLKKIKDEDKISGKDRINEQDEDGMTLLMLAASCHFSASIGWLLSLGANPDIKNEKDGGKTVLDYAKEVKSGSTQDVLMNWNKIQNLCSNDLL